MPAIPVLYVNHVSDLSGAEESLLAMMSRIDREAFTPALACPPGALAARAEEIDVRTVALPMTRFRRTRNPLTVSAYGLAWVTGTNHLRRIIRDIQPKLVHSNSATAHLYAGSVARKAGIPCVWHARDLRPLPFPARTLCRKTGRVIAVSDAVADFLAASGLSRPTVTRVYNGIDPDAWRARVTDRDVRAELGLGDADRILLMAAQFVPWKRHEDAIRALPRILEKEPTARLVLAGEKRPPQDGTHPQDVKSGGRNEGTVEPLRPGPKHRPADVDRTLVEAGNGLQAPLLTTIVDKVVNRYRHREVSLGGTAVLHV